MPSCTSSSISIIYASILIYLFKLTIIFVYILTDHTFKEIKEIKNKKQ